MRLFLLTLMVAACGGPPVSSTKCIRSSSSSDGGKFSGCARPFPQHPSDKSDSLNKLFAWLSPKATTMFSQQQDNGQHCFYEGEAPLSVLEHDYVSIRNVHGRSKAITKFSVDASDVYKAVHALDLEESLKLEMLRLVRKEVFSRDRAMVYYDAYSSINTIHPAHFLILATKWDANRYKKILQIKEVLSWVRSEGASICQQQISI